MKQILLFSLLLLAPHVKILAQEAESITFINKQTNEHRTIKHGDFLKVKSLEGEKEVRYKGSFREVKDGKLFLKGKPGISMENIQSIAYRSKAMRWVIWSLIIIGYVVGIIGLVVLFENPPVGGAIMLACGLLWIVSLIIGKTSLHHMDNVSTHWTYEIQSSPSPNQEMLPIP